MGTNSSHEQWIAQLTAKSKEKQERFMNHIASRLGHSRMTKAPVHPFRGSPDFWRDKVWSTEEKISRFTDNFQSVGGHVARLASLSEASSFIAEKAKEMSAARLIRQDDATLAELQLEAALPNVEVAVWNSDEQTNWKAEAAQADFGVVQADYAVAYTGSVVVTSAKEKGRSVSLLPTVLFLIIPVDCLVTRLGEVLVQFDEAGRAQLPAGIHFITGPSRSSDIENDLTIGVHGPGIVYTLIVG